MKYAFRTLFVVLVLALAVPAWAGDVKLQIVNGRVTLQARDATLRDILTEWARVGQVQVVNADKISGGPMTLDLQDVPESQALNTLLRSVSGYIASPRQEAQATPSASTYDRIVVMAAPRPAATAASYTPPNPTPQPYGYRGQPGMMGNPPMVDDQDQPIGPPPTYPGAVMGRGVLPPGAQQQQQPQGPTPGQLPQGAPGTVSPMPGQQPGAGGTGAPGTVAQPPRRPGGPGGPGGEGGGGQ